MERYAVLRIEPNHKRKHCVIRVAVYDLGGLDKYEEDSIIEQYCHKLVQENYTFEIIQEPHYFGAMGVYV